MASWAFRCCGADWKLAEERRLRCENDEFSDEDDEMLFGVATVTVECASTRRRKSRPVDVLRSGQPFGGFEF